MENKSVSQLSEADSEYDVVEGLSTWEFINPSDDENDAVFAFSDTESDDVISTSPPLNYLMALNAHVVDSTTTKLNSIGVDTKKQGQSGNYDHDYEDEEDDDEDDEDEEDDLDDELVPMSVRGKFGKERIKKLGKRSGPRMNKAKKLAYIYNRPGCVRGLGVQHSYI